MSAAAIGWRDFADAEHLAAALACDIAEALRTALQRRDTAVLAVSGGNTPRRFFVALSQAELDWTRVNVTLVDERWVDEANARSNARSVRQGLLQNAARNANFLPLYDAAFATPEAALDTLEWRWRSLTPPDALVLGMGEDGHFASLFPGGDRLAAALDPTNQAILSPMRAAAAVEPRISMTLPAITAARSIALHIEGITKRAVLERAEHDAALPIHALIATRATLPCYWCP